MPSWSTILLNERSLDRMVVIWGVRLSNIFTVKSGKGRSVEQGRMAEYVMYFSTYTE